MTDLPMPEHVLHLKDADPPEQFTLRWDQKEFVLEDHQKERVLVMSPGQACYRVDLEAFFDNQIGLEIEDGKKLLFAKNDQAWTDLHVFFEKQLRVDENLRYHVHDAYSRSGWLGLALVLASLAGAAGLVLYLLLAAEPQKGVWRFMHRWGVKFGFIILIGVGWTGLSLWRGAWRARRLVREAMREEEWRA
jgi:hypothetical protein